ncbi:MAG: outer membrane protein assembly factor BamD [Sulfurimonas sp.]|nr:MAG: outer membrane protein assembly factor BamD [Sulfurimonas sp.]
MRFKLRLLLLATSCILFFNACSKELEIYNKPAVYWYAKIIESISEGNIDKADNYYASLQGEHIGSPLLPEATMILAISHMYYEDYLLTEHFLDEYVKRYANSNEEEFAEFLKIKAKYMALPNPRRDQVLIGEAILESEKFKTSYPNSMYYSIVDAMATNLYIADAVLNKTIAALYKRIDKPKSAAYYKAIKPQPWIVWNEIEHAKSPWYKAWFEGDGTESWYGYLIPDTRSVVSRNSISDDEEPNK